MSVLEALFASTWVHAFAEDGPEGAVYRPEDAAPKPSRRPRPRITFSRDGSARLVEAGPDDRLREVEARWREEEGEIVVSGTSDAGARELRIRVRPDGSLLVRR